MMRHLVQPSDGIFVKGYGFVSFAKNMRKNFGKIISETCVVNTAKNLLIVLKNLQQIHLKLLQKECFKKQQKQLVI